MLLIEPKNGLNCTLISNAHHTQLITICTFLKGQFHHRKQFYKCSQTCFKRSLLGQRNVALQDRWPLKNVYGRTRKGWPFNTGDCLIEVTTWTSFTYLILISFVDKSKKRKSDDNEETPKKKKTEKKSKITDFVKVKSIWLSLKLLIKYENHKLS